VLTVKIVYSAKVYGNLKVKNMEIWNSLRIKFTHYARVYKMFPLRDSEFENEDFKNI